MSVGKPFDTLTAAELFAAEPFVEVIVLGSMGKAFGRLPDSSEPLAGQDIFELYADWDGGRGQLPPHLRFANLMADEDHDIEAFLGEFGPLHEHAARDRRSLGQVSAECGRGVTDGNWVEVSLQELRAEQEEFLVVRLLMEAVRRGRARDILGELRRYAGKRVPESFRLFRGDLWRTIAPFTHQPNDVEVRKRLGAWLETAKPPALLEAGGKIVAGRLNERLGRVRPVMAVSGGALQGSWFCTDLLEAFYVMLRLDISRNLRLAKCTGCGLLFGGKKGNVAFCSPICSNRYRWRKWDRTKRKKARSPKRAKSRSRIEPGSASDKAGI